MKTLGSGNLRLAVTLPEVGGAVRVLCVDWASVWAVYGLIVCCVRAGYVLGMVWEGVGQPRGVAG